MPEYGKAYITSPLGVLKILEIALCIVVIALETEYTGSSYTYNDLFNAILGAGVTGLVLSLLILILSCACGQDCDGVLKWQFIVHLLMTVWFLVCCIILAVRNYNTRTLILSIMGIIAGVIYLVDTILSYKEYKPL